MASHTSQAFTNQLPQPLISVGLGQMALGVVARHNWHMHMTKADGSRDSGSDDCEVKSVMKEDIGQR